MTAIEAHADLVWALEVGGGGECRQGGRGCVTDGARVERVTACAVGGGDDGGRGQWAEVVACAGAGGRRQWGIDALRRARTVCGACGGWWRRLDVSGRPGAEVVGVMEVATCLCGRRFSLLS